MSQFSKLKSVLTPKSGGAVTAFVIAFLLELVVRLGKIALFVLIVLLMIGLVAVGVFVGHKLGTAFLGATMLPVWIQGATMGHVYMGKDGRMECWDFESPRAWWFWRYEPIEDEL